MDYKLFKYQDQSVAELVTNSSILIKNRNKNNQYILLEAITGSGKTVMSTDYIEKMFEKSNDLSFIWISIGKGSLEEQTYKKLKSSLSEDITVINKEEIITRNKLSHKDLLVLNWESLNNKDKETGEFTNVLMREGEKRNLIEIIKKTKEEGTDIVLFIDESHSMAKSETSKEIINLIGPLYTVEITATPDKKQLGEDLVNKKAIHVQVNPEDVIEEGVIKKSILINNSLTVSSDVSSIEILLENALDMHSKLAEKYEGRVNPLILIQIPNKTEGEDVKRVVKNYLSNRQDFDVKKELAIWLSDKKDDKKLKNIDDLQNPVKCLLFKQSVATGWDCPRAQILVKLRESKSETFDLQVIGRILRMPELSRRKHYDDDILNHAYIYTNIDSFKTDAGLYSSKVLPQKTDVRDEFKNDLIELSASKAKKLYDKFRPAKFNKKFVKKITDNFKIKDLFDISDIEKDYSISEVEVKDINILNEDISQNKESVSSIMSIHDIDKEYTKFISSIDNKNKNHIKNAIKMLFFSSDELDDEQKTIVNVQKTVLNKSEIFKSAIVDVLKELKVEVEYEEENYTYKTDESVYYASDVVMDDSYKKSFYFLVPKTSFRTEMLFENKLDNHNDVKYWIKNKDRGASAFSIVYECNEKLLNFYPDYIVKFNDEKIGLYEVKSTTDRDAETTTKDKQISLLKYCIQNNNNIVDVQIVKVDSSKDVFEVDTLGKLK